MRARGKWAQCRSLLVAGLLHGVAGCVLAAEPVQLRPGGVLEARYRMQGQSRSMATATAAYRNVIGRALSTRCEMLPSDSQLFDRRLRSCGSLAAVALSAGRIFLEVAADPSLMPVVVADGRVRFVDQPSRGWCGL